MKYITTGVRHFLSFHKGQVNIILHLVGFIGVFYSILKLNWVLFAISLFVLEFGHIYNHIRKIEKYDTRPEVVLWRILIFTALVVILYSVRLVLN